MSRKVAVLDNPHSQQREYWVNGECAGTMTRVCIEDSSPKPEPYSAFAWKWANGQLRGNPDALPRRLKDIGYTLHQNSKSELEIRYEGSTHQHY